MNPNSDGGMSAPVWQRLVERVSTQDWPAPALYVVATPIGNLADFSVRAWQALLRCDVIAAEDTRASRVLMDAWGIDTPLMAAHRHNEAAAAQAIIQRLDAGERVALVSDAGAPAVSDPGARIVRSVRERGFRIVPVPGASAVITALMASGATSDENPAFIFAGFMPPKAAARRRWLQQWCALPAPVVMFEAPHRLAAAVADIASVCGPSRPLTFARELTKRFEEVATMAAGNAEAWLSQDANRERGELVLIVHQAPASDNARADDVQHLALADELLGFLSTRDAARVVAKVSGMPKDVAYRLVLERSGKKT